MSVSGRVKPTRRLSSTMRVGQPADLSAGQYSGTSRRREARGQEARRVQADERRSAGVERDAETIKQRYAPDIQCDFVDSHNVMAGLVVRKSGLPDLRHFFV